MKITCSNCNKDISNEYSKLKYKILDDKNKKVFFKGTLCQKCLKKEEDKLSKAKIIYQIDESVHLHQIPKKKHRRYK